MSYPELLGALGRSPLLRPASSFVVLEYPTRDRATGAPLDIGGELGPLIKLRDRRYGRTNLAIYGPASLRDRVELG